MADMKFTLDVTSMDIPIEIRLSVGVKKQIREVIKAKHGISEEELKNLEGQLLIDFAELMGYDE